MRKLNNYICFGLLINVFWIISKQLFQLPEFINGFCVGLAIILILLGAYRENHDINKLKNFKRNIPLRLRH
ncbi:hypothetical protein R0131_05185 [Clostridium sp. AL.422]|uniref:hypothetical protein n=1 Tax=Clostridium TaxID=1485 RepID=UPI00293DF9AB|nr:MULTISPECIES: hypothetical protein [unclassified Clostridium]MDV4150227.1 hypothetical protein [Clostridium sp. AL.422]